MGQGRKVSQKLLSELTDGELTKLLDYLKSDQELRLEVRRNYMATVYYRKGKALEISGNARNFRIDKNYWKGKIETAPDMSTVTNNPKSYFEYVKKIIDEWLSVNPKNEFDSQQKIASSNQEVNDRFIILDMEYGFSQTAINILERIKGITRFDLLGIDRTKHEVVFFELKKGLVAIDGKSGIEDHYKRFLAYLYAKNEHIQRKFWNNLTNDIMNIIEDKTKLGIIKNYKLPSSFEVTNPRFAFVFEPANPNKGEEQQFLSKFADFKSQSSTVNFSPFLDIFNVNILKDENYKIK